MVLPSSGAFNQELGKIEPTLKEDTGIVLNVPFKKRVLMHSFTNSAFSNRSNRFHNTLVPIVLIERILLVIQIVLILPIVLLVLPVPNILIALLVSIVFILSFPLNVCSDDSSKYSFCSKFSNRS